MILHELTANKESFRPVRFKEGLNVVLAEKAETSGKNDTRNGVGKTTLIEILAFCLGGQATHGNGIVQDALLSWEFTLEMTFKGSRVKVSRAVAKPEIIQVEGNVDDWTIPPDYTELTGVHSYDVSRWRDLLGWALFDLDPAVRAQSDHPIPKGLISCFLRLGQSAYRGVASHALSRADGKENTNLAYLLGLDWEFIGKIKELRQSLEECQAAKKGVETGAFSGAEGNIDTIRVQLSEVEAEIAELEQSLQTFDFSHQYDRLQTEVNDLTAETSSLSNRIASDKWRVNVFKKAIEEEQDASRESIEALYRETGLVFPDNLRRTLDDVLAFHRTIVLNRQAFLGDEIARLNKEIQSLTKTRDEKSKIKGEKTAQLATKDIFDDLRNRQNQLAELRSLKNRHKDWIEDLENLDQKMKGLDTDIKTAQTNAKTEFSERKAVLDMVLEDFASFTHHLYGKAGRLDILPDGDEYSISVEMDKGGSDGVRMMGIFCFDLALLKNQSRFNREMSFLVHDTTIFDAVDARQRALALEIADRETRAMHGQYICTMNSDKVPRDDFSKDFDFDSHIIRKLSDATPSDSLLGIHFEVDS